ncbi:MAG: phycobilisome rod-core linker polypeptide [Microcoleaceae cyanobacterium]
MVSQSTARVLGITPFTEPTKVELHFNPSEHETNIALIAAYRQVFGNEHLLRWERLTNAESLLRQGHLTVQDFIRSLGFSEPYRQKFFYSMPQVRFIELNYKHFLGRAPYDQGEIADHVNLFNREGYEAEINSYLNSEEYRENFGDSIVPYCRGFFTQSGQKTRGFTRMFRLYRGYANSDRAQLEGKLSRLTEELGRNTASAIVKPSGSTEGWSYRAPEQGTFSPSLSVASRESCAYRIEVSEMNSDRVCGNQVWIVPDEELPNTLQIIAHMGGQVNSITLSTQNFEQTDCGL